MSFNKLPLELREEIWLHSIPEDEPEVCLLWPVYLTKHGLQPARPLLVDTSWPVAMHVCQESRALMQNKNLGRLLFRDSSAAGCRVPYREFKPEIDTLYWGGESWEQMVQGAEARACIFQMLPELKTVQSLAVELHSAICRPAGMLVQTWLPELKTLSIVLPESKSITDGKHKHFRQPARRCKLQRISTDACRNLTLPKELLGPMNTNPEPAVPLMPVVFCLVAVEWDFATLGAAEFYTLSSFSSSLPNPPMWAEVFRKEIIAQTFVEYQPDGSWKEICAERTFYEHGEVVRSGPYIRTNFRPDPRLVRVNDIDGAFKVAYDSGWP